MSIVFGSLEAAEIVAANRELRARIETAENFKDKNGCTIQERIMRLRQIIDELESERDALDDDISAHYRELVHVKELEESEKLINKEIGY